MESENTIKTSSSAAESAFGRHRGGPVEGGYTDEGHFSSDIDNDSEPCSSFFRCVLKVKDLEFMDTYWFPGIHNEIRNWKGFRHRLVITPPVIENRTDEDELEIVVILYFVGIRNLRSWSTSPEVFV